jgi:citrate/tricarballylate utilization protein
MDAIHAAEAPSGAMPHATAALAEADRLMTVCNSCRYCEGLCAVFPAMEQRRAFADADLRYLADLCHSCGACYHDCQFAPPHEFAVNVPATLAAIRAENYAEHAWPKAMRVAFVRNASVVGAALLFGVVLFAAGFLLANGADAVGSRHVGAGAFYVLMPHNAMVAIFGIALLAAILALGMSGRVAWREAGGGVPDRAAIGDGLRAAATLRNLDGGGVGCFGADDRPTDRRRLWHHLTAYGFLLCFAATSVATLYHYVLGREAPYPWWDAPVVLGTVGGVGLLVGPVGLLWARLTRDPMLRDAAQDGSNIAFTSSLFLTGLTGLALLLARATPVMGTLLALHLGVVFGLFVTLPYGKFVHGPYRLAALIRSAMERRQAGH